MRPKAGALLQSLACEKFDPITVNFVIDASGASSIFASEYGSAIIQDRSLV